MASISEEVGDSRQNAVLIGRQRLAEVALSQLDALHLVHILPRQRADFLQLDFQLAGPPPRLSLAFEDFSELAEDGGLPPG